MYVLEGECDRIVFTMIVSRTVPSHWWQLTRTCISLWPETHCLRLGMGECDMYNAKRDDIAYHYWFDRWRKDTTSRRPTIAQWFDRGGGALGGGRRCRRRPSVSDLAGGEERCRSMERDGVAYHRSAIWPVEMRDAVAWREMASHTIGQRFDRWKRETMSPTIGQRSDRWRREMASHTIGQRFDRWGRDRETGVCQRKTCRSSQYYIRVPGKDVCDNRVHKVRLVPDKGETGSARGKLVGCSQLLYTCAW